MSESSKGAAFYSPNAVLIYHTLFTIAFLIASKYVAWIYIVVSILVAGYFCIRKDIQFVSFSLWLYFLSPFYRRVYDWQIGRTEESVIILVPTLVSVLPFYWLITSKFKSTITTCLFLIIAVVGYALSFNLITRSYLATGIYQTLGYVGPLLMYVYILVIDASHEQIRSHVKKVALWFLLIGGTYGLYQYASLPPWDAAWMQASGLSSIGKAVPGEFRIFGTLNSTGPYAYVMVFCFIYVLFNSQLQSKLEAFAMGVGSVAILLAMVRSSWVMLVVAAIVGMKKIPARFIAIGVVVLFLSVVVGMSLFSDLSASEKVSSRLESLLSFSADRSFSVRLTHYSEMLERMVSHPLGMGFGTARYGANIADDGFNIKFAQFGPLWGLVYYLSVYWILFLAWKNSREDIGLKCLLVGLLVLELFSNLFFSLTGILLFLVAGLMMRDRKKKKQLEKTYEQRSL